MCPLCSGTHVVYEITSIGYRTSCCPECGPEPQEVWQSRMESLLSDISKKEEEMKHALQ